MNTITFKGSPLTLVGRPLREGAPAPGFRAVGGDLKEVTLADFKGKIKIITSFPSLDTPVCDLQVKEFNKAAGNLSSEAVIVGISKDLPFAQKRFCDTFEITQIRLLSDYKASSFGINYGLLIKELNLLARAVIIIDKNDIIRYIQIVPELTAQPNYQEALGKLAQVIKSPGLPAAEELPAHCTPCEGGVSALSKETVEKALAKSRGWQLVEGKKITKEFKFNDFQEAKYLLDIVSGIAEEEGHHPSLTISYGKLKISLTTHAAGGLTDNDFIMARIIDQIGVGS